MKSPKAAFGLMGANLASRVILSTTLWLILEAIGTPLPLVTCLVVVSATNLLNGLMPVPGGIGVAEAAMSAFPVLAGIGDNEAFAAQSCGALPPSTSRQQRVTSPQNGWKTATTSSLCADADRDYIRFSRRLTVGCPLSPSLDDE